MARVDYTGTPTVEPETQAPDDYGHEQASPASFGAPLAQGAEAAGQGALDLSKFYGQVAADNGSNNYNKRAVAVLRGDPNKMVPGPDGTLVPDSGYFGLRGADAMGARASIAEQLEEIRQEERGNLSTPEAQHQFDTQTRRQTAQYASEMGTHYDQQFQQWAVNTNDNTIALTQNQVANHLTNPDALAQDQEAMRQAFVKKDQAQFGSGPGVAQGAVLKADQSYYQTAIRAAIGTNPTLAQKFLDESGSTLASLPQYDGIVRQVKEAVFQQTMTPAVDGFVTTALADAHTAVHAAAATGASGAAVAPALKSAILGEESHDQDNIPSSLRGAVGPGQILPATFAQYAHPGENIDNPADNRAVSGRILDHYLQVYGGDAARATVAYFSGPGNVAPVGSATPYLHNASDGHETVSQYVAHVESRIGPQNAGATGAPQTGAYPTVADALNANMTTYLTQAQAQAEKLFPNYPDEQERYVQTVERRLNQTVDQQRKQYEVDAHIVQSAMAGSNPPISEDQLTARGPQVANAWNSLQFSNPYVRQGIENRFNVNSKGKALTYGTNFKDYFDRAMAPSGDPGRITDPTQFNNLVGPGEDAALTNTGSDQLSSLMALRSTPQGETFAAQARAFVDQAHADLTFSNPSVGTTDKQGEVLFSKAMAQIAPKLMDAYKTGNLDKVLNPKDPDYLGNIVTSMARTPAQVIADRIRDKTYDKSGALAATLMTDNPAAQGFALLKESVARGAITPRDAARIANHLGFTKAPPAPGAAPAAKPGAAPQFLQAPAPEVNTIDPTTGQYR